MPRGLSTCTLILGLLLVFAVGCSGGNSVIQPPLDSAAPPVGQAALMDANRVSWGMFFFNVNEDHTAIDIEPLREANFHINVQPFVEYLFCTDCLRITNIAPSGHNSLLVDIMLTHPFATATDLTGFDVRGTAIFNAEKLFPNTFMPDNTTQITASARLLNADGWTTHFNAEDPGYYEKGKMVAPWLPAPTGNLHPFKAYWTDPNRRMFEVGQSDTRTYDLRLPPGNFVFGYSVDASWEPPVPNPPVTIPDDFPITANSVEAFQLSPNVVANSLTRTGGSAVLEIEVFDWQGPSTIQRVFVEAPDLFAGTLDMVSTGLTTPTSEIFTVTLNNLNMGAPTATGVDVLVVAEDVQMTTNVLDLRMFNIVNLPVADVDPTWRPRGTTFHNIPLAPAVPDGVRDFGVGNPEITPGGGNFDTRVYIKKDSTSVFWRYNRTYDTAEMFAGYPGSAPSWLKPTARMDVTNKGVMAVTSLSWAQDLQPAIDNYNMSLVNFFYTDGLYNHSWYSKADIPGNPNDYQERAIDMSAGWGGKFGDPMYALYAYELTASGGLIPSDVSIMGIRSPYNDSITPLPAIRTTVPRGVGPGMVDENTVKAFGIDDQPAGMQPNSNLAYILDDDGIEVFEVYFVNLPSIYRGLVPTAMIPVPGITPVDIACIPAFKNQVWTGSGGLADNNWIAVLVDIPILGQFAVGILEWNPVTNLPNLLYVTPTYDGTPLGLDVDITHNEIHVLADNGGVVEATVFEYY